MSIHIMLNDDFFVEGAQEQPQTEVEKIKVGEEEYTQDELQQLVGLGKIGREAENKYKTRIDRVWPNYQRIINEKQAADQEREEMRKQLQEYQNPKITPLPGAPLTPDQIRTQALAQAKELGLVTRDEVNTEARKIASEMLQGQKLIDDISTVITNMQSDGLPSTTIEEVIAHMQETGIKNPEKAYKDMFEKEYINSQASKISSIKSKGIPSIETSAAGGKLPPPVKPTKDNLYQLVAEAVQGNYQ